MPFDITKLPLILNPQAGVNGDLYERIYKRHQPKWYSPFCRHGAFTIYSGDTFPMDPTGQQTYVFQRWTMHGSDDELLLVTSACLVCGKFLLEGRLKKPDGSETSLGALYVLTKDKLTVAPKGTPESELLDFYKTEWEFINTLLADFNKLTIAVAVAAAVFFDKYPSVFYAFIATCFIMLALYGASYFGQKEISRKFYAAAGRRLTPTFSSGIDTASKRLQVIFGIGIVVVLCLMIRAERDIMSKERKNSNLEETRPYNPAKTQDTRPFNPAKIKPLQEPAAPPVQSTPPPAPVKKQD
jgi:hypothetical protein